VRTPMVMDVSRARDELGFSPRFTSRETLAQMAAALWSAAWREDRL